MDITDDSNFTLFPNKVWLQFGDCLAVAQHFNECFFVDVSKGYKTFPDDFRIWSCDLPELDVVRIHLSQT